MDTKQKTYNASHTVGEQVHNINISQILDQAKEGALEQCSKCPWSPKQKLLVSFGVSCTKHGIDWRNENKANSMRIVQDPANTTPQSTSILCGVCNQENRSDKTAQQGSKLWNATVSMDYSDPEKGGYMKKHYRTNAIMHGASSNGTPNLRTNHNMKEARRCCSKTLASQIVSLQPNVVIASGEAAVDSLYEIGILDNNWDTLRHSFNKGAYQETVINWRTLPEFTVFCTYHTSARVVNQTVSERYNEIETEEYIEEKSKKLNSPKSVKLFLSEYSDIQNKNVQGMRYLLNHWLDIGEKIRTKYNTFWPTANSAAEFKH